MKTTLGYSSEIQTIATHTLSEIAGSISASIQSYGCKEIPAVDMAEWILALRLKNVEYECLLAVASKAERLAKVVLKHGDANPVILSCLNDLCGSINNFKGQAQ